MEGFHFSNSFEVPVIQEVEIKEAAERRSTKHQDSAYPCNNYYPETVSFFCKQCRGLLAMNVRILQEFDSEY